MRAIADHFGVALSTASRWVLDIEQPARLTAPDDVMRAEALPVCRAPRWLSCTNCRQTLPEELFARMGSDRQSWCRRCFSAYQRDARERAVSRRGLRLEAGRAYVLEHLRDHPCADCGADDPVVLEFDHLRDKQAGVSDLVLRGAPIARLAEELALCEVVCVNCHRRRTHRRRRDALSPSSPVARPLRARNMAYLRTVMNSRGCIDCGERDAVVLDFDHLGEKTAGLSRLAHSECAISRLDGEIAKCVVRCGNCHRRKTAEERQYYRHRAVLADREERA